MDTIWYAAIVAFGFGAVIFIHELGHFIAAKLSKIKVDAFSIGFPPVVFAIKRTANGIRLNILPDIISKNTGEVDENGQDIKEAIISLTFGGQMKEGETEYRIGLIPLGGFVKMMGQEDIGPVKKNDDPRSYANKPAMTRIFVLASGVIFNAVSAVFIFMAVFLAGINMPPPIIGSVRPNSPAEKAGIKAGDEVIEIDGDKTYIDFTSIQLASALADNNQAISLKLKRPDGTIYSILVTPVETAGEKMKIIGVWPSQSLELEKLSDDKSFEKETGLKGGDVITAINGVKIDNYRQLFDILSDLFVPQASLTLKRKEKSVDVGLPLSVMPLSQPFSGEPKDDGDLQHICSIVPLMKITEVIENGGEEPNLIKGDVILSAGGMEYPTYIELRKAAEENCNKEMEIKVLRKDENGQAKEISVKVTPRKNPKLKKVLIGITLPEYDFEHPVAAKTIHGNGVSQKLDIPRGALIIKVAGSDVGNFYDVINQIKLNEGKIVDVEYKTFDGKSLSTQLNLTKDGNKITAQSSLGAFIPFKMLQRLYKADNPSEAIVFGWKKTVMFIEQTYITLHRLFTGAVSPDNLMGPVGILSLSYKIVSEQPIIYYVFLMGLISACIAVFNFLPIPPLDGGLAVIVIAEKIKGSSLSEKTQAVIAYAGWVMILSLFVYVTFNDVVRSFF